MSISMDEKMGRLGLNLKQILVLAITFIVATVLTVFGWTYNCFGLFLVGIGLYMIPHMAKVENVKLLTAYGVTFFIFVLIIGTALVAPSTVDAHDQPPENDEFFTDIEYSYNEGEVTFTSNLSKAPTGDVIVRLWTVSGIGFFHFDGSFLNDHTATVTEIEGNYTATVTFGIDDSKLYLASFVEIENDGNSNEIEYTDSWLTVDAYSGNLTTLCLMGAFMATVFVMIIFFMVLFLSAFMRNRLEKTRTKMEAEGRLYPKGYGRCEECGAIVLPGEINCRKCGAYINRPEEMKPQKLDFFTCSECGAEVPADAKTCPKCGSAFDDEIETEVVHADGSIDVTTKTVVCPECSEEISAAAKFCPKCGKKFDNEN